MTPPRRVSVCSLNYFLFSGRGAIGDPKVAPDEVAVVEELVSDGE